MKQTVKRSIILLALVVAAVCSGRNSAAADKVITLSFTGDCTIGSEEWRKGREESLDLYADENGYDYFFANFRDMFSADDCTVVNLECVLMDNAIGEKTGKTYRFRGQQEYTRILTSGSVEVADLANNHTADYGAKGMTRTIEALEEAGIAWIRAMDYYILEKDGIRVCFIGSDYSIANTMGEKIRKTMVGLKESGQADAIVMIFHNGNEYDAKHSSLQEKMGAMYVAAGADLVIMHHAHVVQGIRILDNRTICYSLGNFVFGGNKDIKTVDYRGSRQVTSLYSLVVQAKLFFSDDGTYRGQQVVLYPAYTSSAAPKNNYQPILLTAEQAEPVMDAIQFDTADMTLPEMTADADGFMRVVMPYLSAGTEPAAEPSADGMPEAPAAKPDRNNK